MRIPPSIYTKLGRFLLFVGIEIFCILCICNNGIVQKFKIAEWARGIEFFLWEKKSAVIEYSNLKDINAQLAQENKELLKELCRIKMEDTSMYVQPKEFPFEFINAKVIKNTIGSSHNYLLIDKGSNHGIEEDMGVITPNGVVGITWSVGENFSYVVSFLNNQQQISAKIGASGTFGPLTWDGISSNKAFLSEIPQHIDVTAQDTIYTSGYSSLYPPGIPIGIATDSRIVNGTHRIIDVTLFQDFSKLNNVMVVQNTKIDQIKSLENIEKWETAGNI